MSCSFCNERFSKSNKLIHECGKRESICGDRYEMLREEMHEKSNRHYKCPPCDEEHTMQTMQTM